MACNSISGATVSLIRGISGRLVGPDKGLDQVVSALEFKPTCGPVMSKSSRAPETFPALFCRTILCVHCTTGIGQCIQMRSSIIVAFTMHQLRRPLGFYMFEELWRYTQVPMLDDSGKCRSIEQPIERLPCHDTRWALSHDGSWMVQTLELDDRIIVVVAGLLILVAMVRRQILRSYALDNS